jgi:hypothetical protein
MKYLPLIFVFIIPVIALKSLFISPYLPLMHDQVQAERVYEMAKGISFGQFPVRFVGDLGYGFGYPLFNYYAPLPYYIGSLFFLLGTGLIPATKIMILFPFILAGISMYIFSKQYWGRAGGMLSALLYVLAPYHGVQLYVRGSIGELYTYALIPFICLGFAALWEKRINRTKALIGVVALAALGMSHTLGLFMSMFLILPYFCVGVIYLYKKNYSMLLPWIKHMVLFILSGLALSAFFWIPAFAEIGNTRFSIESGNNVNYLDHFVTLGQLWNSPWGFAGSAPGVASDGMSFMIGKTSILIALVVLCATRLNRKQVYGFTFLAAVSIFLMMDLSRFIWWTVPYLKIIQFPWRYLIFANLSICFISGGFVSILRKVSAKHDFPVIIAIFSIFIAFTSLFSLSTWSTLKTKYFESSGNYSFSEKQIVSPKHLRFESSKISDEYLPIGVMPPSSLDEVSSEIVSCLGLCLVKEVTIEPTQYQFSVNMEKTAPVYIDKAYFPNFIAQVDGERKDIIKGTQNMLGVSVDAGKHKVKFVLKDTLVRTISNTISLLSFIVLILYPFRSKIWNLK